MHSANPYHCSGMATHFTPAALTFLRGLIRHNDREWFEARREIFEAELKAPMLALIGEINEAMAEGFAPEHVREPRKIMMRIYRDIRFSPDKRPYKRHMSAWWARRGMEKTSGGGFYLQISPGEVLIAAGCYMPERAQLLAIRRWMAEHHEEYRALEKRVLKPRNSKTSALTRVEGQPLSRMPKGFAADHPADELLRARNWGVHLSLPGEAALAPSLLAQVVAGFRRAAPLVDALNAAIDAGANAERTPAERAWF